VPLNISHMRIAARQVGPNPTASGGLRAPLMLANQDHLPLPIGIRMPAMFYVPGHPKVVVADLDKPRINNHDTEPNTAGAIPHTNRLAGLAEFWQMRHSCCLRSSAS